MTETLTFEPVHECWQSIILDSIRNYKRPVALPYLGCIEHGHTVVAWDNSDEKSHDNRSASYLMHALTAYANRCERHGAELTAADCRWLRQKLSVGDLTVIDTIHLAKD